MNKPLITVIVPIYKAEKFLRPCLDSIIHQTYKNLEIILIDDGSPDNSGKICDEYAESDNRITVFHSENKGVSEARNHGIKVATGEFISFIDADDYISDDFYEYLVNIAEDNNSDITYCSSFSVDSNNQIVENPNESNIIRTFSQKEAIINCLRSKEGFRLRIMNAIYRKEIVTYFTKGRVYAEDQEFIINAYLNSKIIAFGYLSKYYYRLHMSVAKSLDSLTTIKNQDAALELVWQLLKDANCDSDIIAAYYNRCMLIDFIKLDCYCNDTYRNKTLYKEIIHNLKKHLKMNYKGVKGIFLSLILGLPEPVYTAYFHFQKRKRKW